MHVFWIILFFLNLHTLFSKPLTANVTTIDKEKARVKLKQGKDIIFAYAEKDKPERAKEFLKHVKVFYIIQKLNSPIFCGF